MAAIVAVAVNAEGKREIIGLHIGRAGNANLHLDADRVLLGLDPVASALSADLVIQDGTLMLDKLRAKHDDATITGSARSSRATCRTSRSRSGSTVWRSAGPSWATFLKSLVRRGLRGTKLVISDTHEGLKAAIRRVMGSTWQRCRVHWMRNAQAYVPKGQQNKVAAALRQAFIQPDRPSASQTLRHVADQLRPKWPKLAAFAAGSQ